MCISVKFPVDAVVGGLHFENYCFKSYHICLQNCSTTLLLGGSHHVHERTHPIQIPLFTDEEDE